MHGVSFANKHAPESLLPKFHPPVSGSVNIGMLHTSVDGSPAHGLYAPCAACRSPWRGLRLLGARPHSSAVRGAGQGGDRDAGKSSRARHQRGRPEVGDAGDNRRRPQDQDRRAADERCAVRARSHRSCRRRRLAGCAQANRKGASRRARRGVERASGGAAHAYGRDAARLAAALGRRHAGGRIARAWRCDRQDLDRQDRARLRRAAERTRARRPAIRSPSFAR